jgi:phospholipid/cholesterol/gamma-HCH transport system permease protein
MSLGPISRSRSGATPSRPSREFVGEVGDATYTAMSTMVGLIGFFGALLIAVGNVVRHPATIPLNAVVTSVRHGRREALGIVGLMSFLVGIVIAQQGAVQLRQFGAEVFTINLIGRIAVKELGVLMTAIMVAGRSGSAFAAKIGSMKLNEEDRRDAHDRRFADGGAGAPARPGDDPYDAAARLLRRDHGDHRRWHLLLDLARHPADHLRPANPGGRSDDRLWQSLIKAPVFGLIIAMAGCYQGLQVEGNAEDVGLRTTTAVVQGIFLVIVLDAFFAVFFTEIGWL